MKNKNDKFSKEILFNTFSYNKEEGRICWKNTPRCGFVGKRAGFINCKGYRVIYTMGFSFMEHRLVWLFEHGELPSGILDHINGDKTDNRIENLREATNRLNQQNTKRHRAGFLVGSSWCKTRKKWKATIGVDGKSYSLGYHKTAEEAHKRYVEEINKRGLN